MRPEFEEFRLILVDQAEVKLNKAEAEYEHARDFTDTPNEVLDWELGEKTQVIITRLREQVHNLSLWALAENSDARVGDSASSPERATAGV